MDTRLHIFRTVAKTLNFHRAAEQLELTQPAVSRQILELEKQVKASLFDRSQRQIRLTPAGQLMLKYADRISELYETMEVELSLLGNEVRGDFRLGASTTIAHYIIPYLLASFRREYPVLGIQLETANSHEIEQQLVDHKIDLGLIEGKDRLKSLNYLPFLKDQLVLVTRPPNARRLNSPLKVSQLKNLPWVMREAGSGTADMTRHALAAKGLNAEDLNVTMYLGSSEAIKCYLLCSDTFAILSRNVVKPELERGLLIEVEVEGLNIQRQLWMVHRAGEPTPLARRFMDHCKQQISDIRNRPKQAPEPAQASTKLNKPNRPSSQDFCI